MARNTPSGPTGNGKTDVACDTCVLINFLIIDRMDILKTLLQYRFIVLDAVDVEITKPRQRRHMDIAYQKQIVYRAEQPSISELAVFNDLTQSMGTGEAACLAAAQERGCMLASDEKKAFRRIAVERIGGNRIIGTENILVAAIKNGSITVPDADEAKEKLEQASYKMSFSSFSQFD